MILAGTTYDIIFADGTKHRCTFTLSDETRYERQTKTSLMRYVTGSDAVPAFVLIELAHMRLIRDGVDVPLDIEEFEDLLDPMWLELVDEGKAAGSDPGPSTG